MARRDEAGGASGADLDEIERLTDHINTMVDLVDRYDQREQRNPVPEIGGGSLSLLINLYRASLEWLPSGVVRDSVIEVLTSREMADPEPLMVSDQIDTLVSVTRALQRVAKKLLRNARRGQ